MKDELDNHLCNKFPKIFKDRHTSMQRTAMCWGFEHGDGWFSILYKACQLIQHHIDDSRKARLRALLVNRAMKTNDVNKVARAMYSNGKLTNWWLEQAATKLAEGAFDVVPDACPQVVAMQVKEKFGTLRFYVSGGDSYTAGIIDMAEAMSSVTCENCGKPGQPTNGGWIKTACEDHA